MADKAQPDLFERRYPDVPGHAGIDTSIAASRSMEESAGTLRKMIRDFIKETGNRGATCDEAEVRFNMRHQTASARIRELIIAGEIIDTGDRRATRSKRGARIYVIRQET